MTKDELDPRDLIREAYAIEGIGAPECRSIFLDWALGVPEGQDPRALVRRLLERHGGEAATHPMTKVLQAALEDAEPVGRRGGRAGRLRG
ncbi:MAG: hypothetical protein GC146_14080 [Limimaricola sp.]|uniref:hypothetical protein n=1 Tax=Limimaricola sp. TaxID=2211665 RepID=UPI001DA5A613|nr:hypothetical protein [Limimaricola sp.]MBI1418345.1 hypothetical protein [Limimaricola sp.]